MLVSFRHRFVFIAVPKCGTTALEAALRPHMPTRLAGPPGVKHAGLRDFDTYLRPLFAEKGFDDFTTVGAVREPIDWLMSWWRYRSDTEFRKNNKYAGHVTFPEFVDAYLSPEPPVFANLHLRHPSELLTHDGRRADEIFRYENIDGMVAWLSERLGVELQPPTRNQSIRPRVDVSPALRDRLRKALAADYELWEAAR